MIVIVTVKRDVGPLLKNTKLFLSFWLQSLWAFPREGRAQKKTREEWKKWSYLKGRSQIFDSFDQMDIPIAQTLVHWIVSGICSKETGFPIIVRPHHRESTDIECDRDRHLLIRVLLGTIEQKKMPLVDVAGYQISESVIYFERPPLVPMMCCHRVMSINIIRRATCHGSWLRRQHTWSCCRDSSVNGRYERKSVVAENLALLQSLPNVRGAYDGFQPTSQILISNKKLVIVENATYSRPE